MGQKVQFENLEDVQSQAQRMRDFYATGATLDVEYRRRALTQLRAYLKANEERVLDALKADLFVVFNGGELQRIRVGERLIRKVEPNFHRQRCKGLDENVVRQVAFARFGERTVQSDEKTVCLRVFFFKAVRGALRPHGVGAGGTCADAVKFLE